MASTDGARMRISTEIAGGINGVNERLQTKPEAEWNVSRTRVELQGRIEQRRRRAASQNDAASFIYSIVLYR
jgi:hypothetical protein